ncbi:MAG TPA: hypothetical protein EYO88_03280 [Alphaproteobacteria bacterium]|nr:hypothetical protein [Alphaproteobacteria bacterium]
MGGSSSKPPSHTTQTVKQNILPEYLAPYVTDVAGKAQAISQESYIPYGAQRIADFDPAQSAAQQQLLSMQTPDFDVARHNLGQVGQYGLQAGQAGINRADQYLAAPTQQFDAQQFDAGQAARYMNPYQQSVTDVALRQAQESALQRANRAALRSAGSGSAGGTRQAVFQAMADRDEGRLLGDIQAKGSERGYLNAQQQFERDRASAQRGFEQDQSTRYRQAQLGSQFGMQGLSAAGQSARGLGELGALQQKTDLERIGAQDRVGGIRQAQQQRGMDQRYADFLRQRDYPKEQMGWYSGILRGLPQDMGSSQLAYNREPSTAQQLAGLGIAGLGAYGAYRGSQGGTQ